MKDTEKRRGDARRRKSLGGGATLLVGIATGLVGCSLLITIDDDFYLNPTTGGSGGSNSGGLGGDADGGSETGGVSESGGGPSGGEGGTGGEPELGPIHHYTFDENEGVVVNDTGWGEEATGTLVPNAQIVRWVDFGRLGSALELENQWVTFPNSVNTEPPFTITLWLWPKKPEERVILDKQSAASEGWRFAFRSVPTVNTPHFWIGGTTASTTLGATGNVPEGEWTHVAITYEPSTPTSGTDRVRFWLNGNLDSGHVQDFEHSVENTITELRLGEPSQGGGNGFIGIVDDLRFYDRILSEEEIVALVEE